jgi:hypothetical protein
MEVAIRQLRTCLKLSARGSHDGRCQGVQGVRQWRSIVFASYSGSGNNNGAYSGPGSCSMTIGRIGTWARYFVHTRGRSRCRYRWKEP